MVKKIREIEAADILASLGNATRLRLFRYLVKAGPEGVPVGVIQRYLKVPASTLSHHISALTRVKLVHQQRKGRELICQANYQRMDRLILFITENCCAGIDALKSASSEAA